ncbi:ATP-binding protein [Campylobacter sp. MIT 99-7217]|uniref:ATP-binding protein n=1 Tax=Campylobacter sp. MIT 99-7217 TaxID=535091 RepID=UPI00115A9DF9|nr:ATP-binding protein [Campylobacter sp. MIT 99-7217]TQR34395.1 ATP-binding protein [Campylobacter sp. MIT 99-7217]
MQVEASKNQNFGFSYTTSTGKSLSLSMFDNKSASASQDENSKSLSLRHEYGFSFSFQGSKLTEDDVSEIKNAMKEIEPILNEFMQNSKVGELKPKDFIQNAMQIANLLPSSEDENKQNATLNNLVNLMDNTLKQHQGGIQSENVNLLEDTKKLFEEVLKQIQEKLEAQKKELEEKNSQKGENQFDFYV